MYFCFLRLYRKSVKLERLAKNKIQKLQKIKKSIFKKSIFKKSQNFTLKNQKNTLQKIFKNPPLPYPQKSAKEKPKKFIRKNERKLKKSFFKVLQNFKQKNREKKNPPDKINPPKIYQKSKGQKSKKKHAIKKRKKQTENFRIFKIQLKNKVQAKVQKNREQVLHFPTHKKDAKRQGAEKAHKTTLR